jgi:hypothetical protein
LAAKIDSSIKRARLAAAFSLERLRQQVAESRSQQFPGDHAGPRQWLGLVSGLLDTAAQYLDGSSKVGISADAEADLVRDAAHLATEAYQCLVLMRGAGADELSYSIVPPLSRWFSQLKVGNSTFFRAELVANYELSMIPDTPFLRVRNPAPSLTKSIGDIKWPFLRVTVPGKAFAIVPHLAIVAHEIGHALFNKITWDISPFASAESGPLIQRINARLGTGALDSRTTKFLNNVFQSWWEELSADAFAFYLTGPAFFFSLPEFSQFLASGYGLSETHPANDLRRSVLFSKLCENGADSFATSFEKHTGQVLSEDFNSPLIIRTPSANDIYNDVFLANHSKERAAVLAELHGSIPQLVSIVYEHVFTYLKDNAADALYSPQKYDLDMSDHLQAMLGAVPPIESRTPDQGNAPTDFASILNIGWAALLTKLADLQVKVSGPDPFGSDRLERLQGLLSKAVELSEARRSWHT